MASQDKQKKMEELTDKLEQGIKGVYESDKYKNYLIAMSKFYSYSFRNSLLIMLQKPEATHVAGFNAWKNSFNRSVNKGEKGLQILAPAPYRIKVDMERIDPITQKSVTELVEITKPAFRPVYVFDISQTSGEPLPQLITELTGNIPQYNAFFESLKRVSPFPIQFEDIQSRAKGYCDPVNQKIAIKTGMSEIQNIKTAIHEITHSDIHVDQIHLALEDRKDRRTKEVEAESVAFVVCNHYGIDTSNYSFAYVAGWSSNKELNELKSSLDTIQKQASELIDRIDTHFQELLKELPEQDKEEIKLENTIVKKNANKGYRTSAYEEVLYVIWNTPNYDQQEIDHTNYDYGKIDFLGSNSKIGETAYYKNKQSFDKEVYESRDIGRPITSQVFDSQRLSRDNAEDKARYNEQLDSVKFDNDNDNDIDLDRERTREQLGFNDGKKPSIKERMESAKEKAKGHNESLMQHSGLKKDKRQNVEREAR